MADINEILNRFHAVASDPGGQFRKYLSEGKKVVGSVLYYVPEEIIHSTGCVPFGMWGADKSIKESLKYYPPFYCSVAQTILELGIEGKFKGMSAIVIPPICDTLRGLGANWRYSEAGGIPYIPMTYPQNRKIEAGKEFTKAGYLRLISDLKKFADVSFDPNALMKSIAVYNEHNKLMRDVSRALADHPSVTAARRSDIFKSAFFMLKEEHSVLVKQLLDALKPLDDSGAKKKRIVTTGIIADAPGLLSVFDGLGFQIVGDDIAAESRCYRTDVTSQGATALDKMADKFARTECTMLYSPDKVRAGIIVDMVKERKAGGVVVIQTKFCDPEEFDYPIIKEAFEKEGIPHTIIEVDRQMQNYEQAKTNLQAFAEML